MRRNPWLSMIPIAMGIFMAVLDMSILNVALPKIAQAFNATASDIQWILNAYLITFVVLLTTFGRIGDVYRRDLVYVAGMGLFTIGSYLCAQSWNLMALIFFRIVQAIGGAMMLSNSSASIAELFPPGKRGVAMGVQSILTVSSFALGPVIGGWVTTHLSWHWVFYINIPIGVAGVILGLLLLPPMGEKTKEPLDIVGLVLIAIGLGSFTLAIIKGQDWGWESQKTICCFLISFPFLFAFVMRELSYEHPLLDLKLFKIGNFSISVLGLFFLSMGLSASLFLLPFFLEGVKGLTAEECGIWLLPLTLVNIFTSPIAGRLSDRVNPRYLMSVGPLIFSIGLVMLSGIPKNIEYHELAMIFMFLGSGMGFVMPVAMNVMITAVPEEKTGMAGGTFMTFNSLARAMGITFGSILFTKRMGEITGLENVIPSPMMFKMTELLALIGKPQAYELLVKGFMESFHHVFLGVEPLIITSFLIIILFLKGEQHLERIRSSALAPSS